MSMDGYSLYERDDPALSKFEHELYDAVSADEPWALVEEFSTLERVTGTDDEKRAAEYLTGRLSALDIEHERYDPELWISQPNGATIRGLSPIEETSGGGGDRPAVKTVSFSKEGPVSGEVIYVERSDVNVMAEIADDIEDDVEGKIILFESVGLSIEALDQLQELGAVGTVLVHPHPEEPHSGIATPIWGAQPHPDKKDRLPDMVIANVSRTVGDRLIELATDHEPFEVEISADVTTGWFNCPVVVAHIPGHADPDEDDFVLLHGHYDSWDVGVTDNATGDAGLLECARVFSERRDRLKRDLWVAWWPGHSTGRYAGSTWFADEFALDLAERCVAHVNMDSPGVKDATEFEDMMVWMPEADALCRGAIADVAGKDTTENRPRRAGDYSFNNLGISGMFALSSNIPREVRDARGYHAVRGSGGNSNAWHLSTDTLDKADPDVLVRDIRVYVAALAQLVGDDVLPLDFRHTVERHRELVAEYDEESGDHFDFGPVAAELDALAEAVDAFYDSVDAGEVSSAVANEAVKMLSRQLVRVNFTTERQFEQDLAVFRPPYPALEPATDLPDIEGDDYRFLRTHLKRVRNAIVYDLREARRGVEAAL